MQVTDPIKFWTEIALFWFPFRHDKVPAIKQNAVGMIRSMAAHKKNYIKWKKGLLKNQTTQI